MRRYGLVDIPTEASDVNAVPVSSDSIISGGIVTWSGTGLVFNVSACNYYIDNVYYNSPDATLTLDAADPTDDRIDVFAVDVNGDAIVITGTPSATPQEPQVDPATQIKLTTVIVQAGATTPLGVANNMIYDENVEAWSKGSNSLTVDYVNTTTPYVGTYCILATTTAASTFKALSFYKSTTYSNKADYDIFSFAIKLSQSLNTSESIKILFLNSSLVPNAKVAEYAITSNNSLGLSFTNTSAYQLIGIPMTNINFTSNAFNYVQIQFVTTRTSISFRLDRILLQYGINQPTSPTDKNSFGNVVSQSGTAASTMATDTLTINGSGLATTSVSGKTLTIAVPNPVSGTLNYVSKFTGTGATIGDSQIFDNGTSVGIGTTTPTSDNKLQVEGKITSNVSTTSTSASMFSMVANTGVTYAGGSTLSSGITINSIQGFSNYTAGGNLTIPNSVITSSINAISGVGFSSTGTITQDQAGGVRTMANIFAMWAKNADVSGTVTHMSNLRLASFYSGFTGTNLTVNNYYGILIEDTNQFGGVTLTNKWAIYQEGSNDNNYFAGKVLIGTITPTTERLNVVGSAIISSTVTLSNLAGTGDRMVVANSSGVLSTQAIPGGGGGMAIGGTITGATAGSVLFAGTSGVLAQDNTNFFWDDANNRLGISTTTPLYNIDINGTGRFSDNLLISKNQNSGTSITVSNTTNGTASEVNFIATSDSLSGSVQFGKYSTTKTAYKIVSSKDCYFYNGTTAGDISFLNDFATGKIKFATNGSSTAQMTLTAAGRLLLGTISEGTNILEVLGASRLQGQTILANQNTTSSYSSALKVIGAAANGSSALYIAQWNATASGIDFIMNDDGILYIRPVNSNAAGSSMMQFARTGAVTITSSLFTLPAVVYQSAINGVRYRLRNLDNFYVGYDSNDETVKLAVQNDGTARYVSLGGSSGGTFTAILTVRPNTNNVGIGTKNANTSSILELSSSTLGFLPPRMTTTQKNAITTPATGLIVYDTTLNKLCVRTASSWETITSA